MLGIMTDFGLMMNVVGCLMLSSGFITGGFVLGLDSAAKISWMLNVELMLAMRLQNDVLYRRAVLD